MWRLGVKNSYTMEASFGGSTLGEFVALAACMFTLERLLNQAVVNLNVR